MRMLKVFGMAMLVAAMVVVLTVAVSAKNVSNEAAVSINASFSIPSWISLAIVGQGDVTFENITGPGSYEGSNSTELRVLSTTGWTISNSILWVESSLPAGASQAILGDALELSYSQTSGSWGVHDVDVTYQFDLGIEDLANLPEGDYNLVIQYTATTD